jgi:hypothetical protein
VSRLPRRRLLWLVLGSIAVNAVLGISALVAPGFGDVQVRILLTSLCVTGAGIVVLACLPAWERRLLGRVPLLAACTGVLGFALLVVATWIDLDTEAYAKAVATVMLVAAVGIHASVLALARLAPRFRAAQPAASALAALVAALVLVQLWAEWSTAWFARGTGVVAVLLAAVTVAVPVLYRATRAAAVAAVAASAPGEQPSPAGPAVQAQLRHCPACGGPLPTAAGTAGADADTICPACGAAFSVRFRAPACSA